MIARLTQPVVIALIALAAVALGCATFLIANGNTVPAELWAVPFAALTGATGIAVPTSAAPTAPVAAARPTLVPPPGSAAPTG